jgi:hypothetical protein
VGTGFDSPGAFPLLLTSEYRQEVARLVAAEPEYGAFNAPLKNFVVRQYTVLVGGVNPNMPGTVMDRSYISLGAGLSGLLLPAAAGLFATVLLQAKLHRIDNIVNVERARETNPILYRIAEDGSNQNDLAVALSEPWARVMAGGASQPSADEIAEVMNGFLAGQRGSQITVRQTNGAILIESATGDTLLLKPDGSGSSVTVNGISATESFYGRGAQLMFTVQAQGDDDGNLMTQVTQAGQRNIFVIGPDGRYMGSMVQYLDEHGTVIGTGYEPPNRSLQRDYMVGPNGQIISSAGELVSGSDSAGPHPHRGPVGKLELLGRQLPRRLGLWLGQ